MKRLFSVGAIFGRHSLDKGRCGFVRAASSSSSPPSKYSNTILSPSKKTTKKSGQLSTPIPAHTEPSSTAAIQQTTTDATESSDSQNTYVSSHVTRDPEEIVSYLNRKDIEFRREGNALVLKRCPACKNTEKSGISSLNRSTGHFLCTTCGKSCSWYMFKGLHGDIDFSSVSGVSQLQSDKNDTSKLIPPFQPVIQSPIVDYFRKAKKLDTNVLEAYDVGFLNKRNVFGNLEDHAVYPWYLPSKTSPSVNEFLMKRIKCFSVIGNDYETIPSEKYTADVSLFGLPLIKNAKKAIITDTEVGAMAAFQGTSIPAVSLPFGTTFIPPAIVPLLESVDELYLWFQDDPVGREGVEKAIRKFGRSRCYVIHSKNGAPDGPIDASEALFRGLDLKAILGSALSPTHGQVLNFKELEKELFDHINDPASAGLPCFSFPTYNKILKGLRRGELTVVTGPTGCGKTTLLSQLSVDFTHQGINTLWGSFEVKNTNLIKKMMTQYFGKDLNSIRSEFPKYADQFSKLQMYFMKFYGSTAIDDIFDAIDFAVYRYDVGHIIIDNLQFMLSDQGKGFDKFDIQDYAISKFRKYATMMNVHITIVIHPRKEEANTQLTTSSVSGTAKATQEADNIVIIQRGLDFQFLDVRKNRYDGTLGMIPFKFMPSNNRFIELSPGEIKQDKRYIVNEQQGIVVSFKDDRATFGVPDHRSSQRRS